MIEICMLASGSSGNAVYIGTERASLLIDAGPGGRRTATALREIGVAAGDLDALLISHDHSDHIRGAGVLSRRYGLPVFATPLTWRAASGKLGDLAEDRRRLLPGRGRLRFFDLVVETFPIPHDAADPVGFLFHAGGRTVALLTDLGHITGCILERLRGVNCLILEANHDERMLLAGTYPWPLKKRILGNSGHLSNTAAADCLANVVSPATRHVVLAHLSEENNHPALAQDTVCDRLERAGYRPGKDLEVRVAERHRPSCHIRLL